MQSLFGPFVIKDRFAEDRAAAGPLPTHRFDPCVIHQAVAVDKYQTVAYDTNRYSVPRPFAFQTVTVKGYVDRVVIVSRRSDRRAHERSLSEHTMVLDPLHYLATLDRKPGVLDHAPVFRDWELPACFAAFRAALERSTARRPAGAGTRGSCNCSSNTRWPASVTPSSSAAPIRSGAEAVDQRVRCWPRSATPAAIATTSPGTSALPQVHVPLPDLSRFDQLLERPPSRPRGPGQRVLHLIRTAGPDVGPGLRWSLSGKDHADGRCHDRVAQDPLPTAPPADDGPGVREAGAGRRLGQPDLRPVPAEPDRDSNWPPAPPTRSARGSRTPISPSRRTSTRSTSPPCRACPSPRCWSWGVANGSNRSPTAA